MRLRGGLGRAALGIAISAVALALVVRTVDLDAAWSVLRSARLEWIALLLAFVALDILLRAVRWRILLAPLAVVPLRATLGSLLVGYLANNVLPARLGEIVRSHHLGSHARVSRSTVLGTIVVERVVDTAVVVSIAAVAILVLSVRGIVASAVLVGLALTALLVVAVAAGIVAHRLPGAARLGGVLARWPRVEDALRRLRTGLSIASDVRTMTLAVLLSVGSWSCTVLAFAAAAQAVGIEPTMGQAALLAAGTNLATAIPAAPGYVGTFELAAVTIAGSVGIAAEPALAFAVLVHAVTLLVTSSGGAVVFAFAGSRTSPARAPAPAPRRAAVEPERAAGDPVPIGLAADPER
jgi:uncharacterized protein (TIRG00374 family)